MAPVISSVDSKLNCILTDEGFLPEQTRDLRGQDKTRNYGVEAVNNPCQTCNHRLPQAFSYSTVHQRAERPSVEHLSEESLSRKAFICLWTYHYHQE